MQGLLSGLILTDPVRPMLATKGDHVPVGDDWVHEIKWDGIRALVDVHAGAVRVFTRTGRDVSLAFPELAELAEVLGDALLDGEIVNLADGVPTLAGLADRIHLTDARKAARMAVSRPVTLLAFDLLRLAEEDLSARPWRERRDALESLGLADVSWQVPEVYDDGVTLLAAAEAQGLEGIVSKKVGAPYHPGARSRSWLKFPIRPTDSFAVVGFRHETDSDVRLGALLLARPAADGTGLSFCGRVGAGVGGKAGRRLQELLTPLITQDRTVVGLPAGDVPGTTFVRPELVVEVSYLRVTADGRLRQPAYLSVRADLTPADLGPLSSGDVDG